MKKLLVSVATLMLMSLGLAQTFQWPDNYAPTAAQEGNVQETTFGDLTTLNPVLVSNASEAAVLGMLTIGDTLDSGTVYRDWLGTRTYRNEAGDFNLLWASEIEEVVPDQEYIVTLKEGWKWSDGTEMTADDVIASFTIYGDPAVESNSFSCANVEEELVEFEKLGTYQYRFRTPVPQVNAVASNDCANAGLIPAHIFMPVYEADGAEGIKALWGVDTPVEELVSGGPYKISEFRAGERVVLEKNPMYGNSYRLLTGRPCRDRTPGLLQLQKTKTLSSPFVRPGSVAFTTPLT